MPTDDFVHLHTHSDYSQLDGLGTVPEYVKAAAARGNRAIAFTDHGTMRGYLAQQEACEKAGVKAIYGCEFYMSPDMRRRGLDEDEKRRVVGDAPKGKHKKLIEEYEESIGLRDRWHLSVWAQSQEGLQNLYRLTSAAWVDGFYYKPRIDIKTLIEYGDGLAVGTGCLASPIHEQWRGGKKRAAFEFADTLYEAFGDRMYLEVQPHKIKIQRKANALICKLRERYSGLKLLATQDAHYVEEGDAEHHDCLLCIGTRATLDKPDRFRFDGDEFFLKTRKEMYRSFRDSHGFMGGKLIKEALDTTVEFSERCNAVVEIDYKKALLPDSGIPDDFGGDAFAYLKKLCLDGWRWRQIPKRAKRYASSIGMPGNGVEFYAERLKFELRLIKKLNFAKYFLIVVDIYREARKRGIMVGPGRGSVGGSMMAYLLGITAMDPIEYGLLFERFIHEGRKDLPDVDMDFEDSRRGELIQYMRDKYGEDRVCQIATVGKLSGKACFKDVCRVVGVPYAEANSLTASIIHRERHSDREFQCIEDSFKEFKTLQDFNRRYPDVLRLATKLEGKNKTLGIHAAGVVASPVPLRDVTPLEVRTKGEEKVVVSALDMEALAKVGLVKLDFLGLKTLTVIRKTLEAIKERTGKTIDLEGRGFDMNDRETLDAFTAHDFVGVFQFDSPSSYSVCRDIPFTRFDDIATMTAINRPGALENGMDESFRQKKNDPRLRSRDDFHPLVTEITSDTLGVMCFQEHILLIFQQIGGFSPSRSDQLRKAIGKKLSKDEINKHRDDFVAGAIKVGVSQKIANDLMDAMVKYSRYGFNKSHATAYGMISYWCMYLKIHYPLEFFWGMLWSEKDTDKIKSYATEAKRRGISILPSSVNTSGRTFTIEGDAIRGGLIDINGIGEGTVVALEEARPFKSFADFAIRIERRKCNKGHVLALAKAGAFGSMINLKWLIEGFEDFWKASGKKPKSDMGVKSFTKEVVSMVEEGLRMPDYDREDKILLASEQNPIAFDSHPIDAYKAFIHRAIKVKTVEIGENYFLRVKDRSHFILVIIKGVKRGQVGDYGEVAPGEPNHGKPYVKMNVEDASGVERRIKLDHYAYGEYQAVSDAGNGKPILCLVEPNPEYSSIKVAMAVDIARLRMKLKAKDGLGLWEKIAIGRHPIKTRPWKSDDTKKKWLDNDHVFRRGKGRFAGVVTYVNERRDKNGNRMATIGILGADGLAVKVLFFSAMWKPLRKKVQVGKLMRLSLVSKKDGEGKKKTRSWFADGGKVSILDAQS